MYMIPFIWRVIYIGIQKSVYSLILPYIPPLPRAGFPRVFLDSPTVNYAVNYWHKKTSMSYWNISIAFRLEVEIKNVVTNNGQAPSVDNL